MRAAVVGHVEWLTFALVDRIPGPGEIAHAVDGWEEPAGGGPVAAVQLRRLSGGCTFFTALGRDDVGRRARLELGRLGLRVEVALREGPSRRALSQIDRRGERAITTLGPRLHPTAADPLPWGEMDDVDAAFFCAGDVGALEHARRARVLVATSREAALLAVADVRLDALVGSARDPAEQADASAFLRPPALLVRTEGRSGGTFETADGHRGRYEPVPPPGPIVDTYGSGDCFVAGLAYALGAGMQVEEALHLAAWCGAWCVAGRGPYGNQLTAEDLRDAAPPRIP